MITIGGCKDFKSVSVIKPEKIVELKYDYVVITSRFYDEMSEQLIRYGIQQDSILNFNDIYEKLLMQDNYELVELLKDNIQFETRYDYELERIREIEERNLFLNAKNFINSVKNKSPVLIRRGRVSGFFTVWRGWNYPMVNP